MALVPLRFAPRRHRGIGARAARAWNARTSSAPRRRRRPRHVAQTTRRVPSRPTDHDVADVVRVRQPSRRPRRVAVRRRGTAPAVERTAFAPPMARCDGRADRGRRRRAAPGRPRRGPGAAGRRCSVDLGHVGHFLDRVVQLRRRAAAAGHRRIGRTTGHRQDRHVVDRPRLDERPRRRRAECGRSWPRASGSAGRAPLLGLADRETDDDHRLPRAGRRVDVLDAGISQSSFSIGRVTRCSTSAGDAPGISANTSTIGTTICGSSSRGSPTTAKAPSASDAMMNSGVSLEWRNAPASLPAAPRGRVIAASRGHASAIDQIHRRADDNGLAVGNARDHLAPAHIDQAQSRDAVVDNEYAGDLALLPERSIRRGSARNGFRS